MLNAKHLFKAALVMLCLAFLAIVGRVAIIGATEYAGSGNQWPGKMFFEDEVNFNDAIVRTPATKTAAFTVALTENKYDLDSTAGAFLVSLPSSATTPPADGQCWEFSLTVANGATSFSPSAVGDLLDASQAAYAGMDALGDSATICYDAGTTNYYFQSRYIH